MKPTREVVREMVLDAINLASQRPDKTENFVTLDPEHVIEELHKLDARFYFNPITKEPYEKESSTSKTS